MEAHRLTLAAALVLVAACIGSNVHTMSFATMAEARAAGAADRGWVPASMPDSAYELRVAYEPDGERRWGIFNFRAEDAGAVRALLQSEETSLSGVRMEIPARIEWWPIVLRGDLDHDRVASTGLRAYRALGGEMIVAVNWKQGRGYYWRQ